MNLANNYGGHRILSHPIKVRWAGWESDTFRLQDEGWELSAKQDVQGRRMGIAMNHPRLNMRGFTDTIDYDYYRNSNPYGVDHNYWSSIRLNCHIASDFIIQHNVRQHSFTDYAPIDARPSMMEFQSSKLSDLVHFRPMGSAKEIFLKQASMNDILQLALDKQAPRQNEIRKEMVHREEVNEWRKRSQVKAELRLVS